MKKAIVLVLVGLSIASCTQTEKGAAIEQAEALDDLQGFSFSPLCRADSIKLRDTLHNRTLSV